MTHPKSLLFAVPILLLMQGLALAQTPRADYRWSRLGTLSGTIQVRAELTSGARLCGAIASVGPSRLTLRRRDGAASVVERSSLRSVSLRSRRRGALYGLLAGFGVGFVTGAAAGPYIADFGNPGAARRVKYGIGLGLFGGGIGAGIGVLTGARVSLYP
ncbi:MAG: hypothetical protein JNL62_00685 [Bryobacterales bacterium]|nr:hypothetical protein [Bryobacterales bacterium]